ncbi:fungal specific transcription factor domain protein [Colletotrichum tofieldiae]|nr:fungal specific transcription factor domain protein [Colletotrichum tofieldiae]
MEISLFWAVFKFEKGLALRLGRPSGIRDAEITLLAKPDEHRTTRIARIQGQVYDQLYSPAGLPTSAERKAQAMKFADELADVLSRAIIHVPFIPFSIIFTCVVRTFNFEDLALLERFAASLKPETTGEDSPTHPYRLYDLLCQAARLYITKAQFSASGPTMARNDSTLSTDFEASQFFAEAAGSIEEFGNSDLLMFDASDWYQGNQQLISLLDEGRLF